MKKYYVLIELIWEVASAIYYKIVKPKPPK